jgi:hypothetical protein
MYQGVNSAPALHRITIQANYSGPVTALIVETALGAMKSYQITTLVYSKSVGNSLKAIHFPLSPPPLLSLFEYRDDIFDKIEAREFED